MSKSKRALTAMERGTRVHQEIERLLSSLPRAMVDARPAGMIHGGDAHPAQGNEQLRLYALAALEAGVICGGDLLHGDDDVERLIGHERTLLLIPDLLRDPLTGRIKPTVNDDE